MNDENEETSAEKPRTSLRMIFSRPFTPLHCCTYTVCRDIFRFKIHNSQFTIPNSQISQFTNHTSPFSSFPNPIYIPLLHQSTQQRRENERLKPWTIFYSSFIYSFIHLLL